MSRTVDAAEARRHFIEDEGWTAAEFEEFLEGVPTSHLTTDDWERGAMAWLQEQEGREEMDAAEEARVSRAYEGTL